VTHHRQEMASISSLLTVDMRGYNIWVAGSEDSVARGRTTTRSVVAEDTKNQCIFLPGFSQRAHDDTRPATGKRHCGHG